MLLSSITMFSCLQTSAVRNSTQLFCPVCHGITTIIKPATIEADCGHGSKFESSVKSFLDVNAHTLPECFNPDGTVCAIICMMEKISCWSCENNLLCCV